MSDAKREISRSIKERRKTAEAVLHPQWRACFWTRPFGHIYDGRGADQVVGAHSLYSNVCLYCGKCEYVRAVEQLERHAEIAGRYPIALDIPKGQVA